MCFFPKIILYQLRAYVTLTQELKCSLNVEKKCEFPR